jgi:hypothetical protein
MAQDPFDEALARRRKAQAPLDPFDEALARRKASAPSPKAPPSIGEEGVVKPRMGAIRAIGTAIAIGRAHV